MEARKLTSLYRSAHNLMRNVDGLQPQEAFDELLKYLLFKQANEERGPRIIIPFELGSNGAYSRDQEQTAQAIRRLFCDYLEDTDSWPTQLWQDKQFHLSNHALFGLHQLFQDVEFANIPFDVRSAALREFLSPGIRRGLGIYLTPDSVARMMVDVVSPVHGACVYDIALGSGTFLIEVLRSWISESADSKYEVWGTDKNPRMLLLADLNLGHVSNATLHRRLMDSLFDPSVDGGEAGWPAPNSFDYIFTNPPFGVVLDGRSCDLSKFRTCKNSYGESVKKQQSEVLFLEQSLRFLRPGGTLAIVLPKSLVSNVTLNSARTAINDLGYVEGIVVLPPETFQMAGTQTTTVVLFMKKYKEGEDRAKNARVRLANVTNVGYDSTGRFREGNQLPKVAGDFERCVDGSAGFGICTLLPPVRKDKTLIELADLLSGRAYEHKGKNLKDVVQLIGNGRTPARSDYADDGLFLVKVGNLTGNGISWVPRQRNFVRARNATRRRTLFGSSMIQKCDILLTSSAHSPVYIAKKVDIVWRIPEWIGGEASFVGEIMLVRPRIDIVDPFVLLAFLRRPETTEEIQRMVRGQTAHLHAEDLGDLPIPDIVLEPSAELKVLAENLRREAILNEEMNDLMHEQCKLMKAFD